MKNRSPFFHILLVPLLLAACQSEDELPQAPKGPVRMGIENVRGGAVLPGTPMKDRVAIVGLLNKRNGVNRDLRIKPGEAFRVGDVIVRLRSCETTAPWEPINEVGAFVQLDILESADKRWHRAFSGWLFRNRPERNVVQHPIYDVWVKSCAMNWPETGPDTVGSPKGEGAGVGASRSSASNAAEPAEETPPPAAGNAPSPRSTPATAAPSNDR